MQNQRFALWLTGIIAVAFALQSTIPEFTRSMALISELAWQHPWTLVTSIFVHGNFAHLLLNGYALAMFGSILEEKAGSWRFLAIFLAAGLLSSVADTFFYRSTLGASGAIFGIFGTLAVLEPLMTVYIYFIPVPLFVAAIAFAALDLFGFFTGAPTSVIGAVANAAHLSGLAAGVIAGFILRGKRPIRMGGKKRPSILTAEEFDKWERENMRKQQ